MGFEAAAAVVGDVLMEGAAEEVVGGSLFDIAAGGALADAGEAVAGGSLFDYAAGDVVGSIVSDGLVGVADAAGAGLTYDAAGNVVANEIGANLGGAALSGAADAAANTAISAVTDAEFAQASTLMKGGMSAFDAAKKVLGDKATGGLINGLVGALATGAGSLAQANAAKNNGAALSAASQQAAGVLAPAITNAAGLQSDAAKKAGADLSAAATAAAATQSHGAMEAANTLSAGDLNGAKTLADGYDLAGNRVSNAAVNAANTRSQAALLGGQTLSGAYKNAADMEVSGYNNAIGTARDTLSKQTENQKPYMAAGTAALTQLQEGLRPGGQFNRAFTMQDAQNSEAYKFALGQGKEAINNASAAGGLQLSSANIQSLGKFAEGTASQFEQQAFEQWMAQNNMTLSSLQNLVNTGQISTNQLQGALAQAGVSIETLQSNIGRAQAAGELGSANAQVAAYNASAGDIATGMTDSAKALSDADRAKAAALAAGQTGSAAALAGGQSAAANYLAGGQTSAANAAAAGDVSSAGYLANGMTGAAGVTANGITGGANSIAAGNVGAANALSSGATAIGNQLAKGGVFSNIPQNIYTLASGNGV